VQSEERETVLLVLVQGGSGQGGSGCKVVCERKVYSVRSLPPISIEKR
jgi:hypothetical protein